MSDTNNETSETATRTCGQVKWFNNKAGYGFISVSDGERQGEDVFVHHSAITTNSDQYKYLVQGEYVTFEWSSVEDDNHEWQAAAVKGVNDGKLMCETRQTKRSRAPRANKRTMKDENGEEWLMIKKK